MDHLDRINYFNVLAMVLACCLAMVIPFELVLLSYAVLGPAHYLTEISWLKGKQFFTAKRYDYLIIMAITAGSLLLKLPYANLVFYTFGLSLVFLFLKENLSRLLAAAMLVAAGYFLLANNLVRTIFGLYMLTLIHVYFFTGAFLLSGALKSKKISGYFAVFIFTLCPVGLFTLFAHWHNDPSGWAMNNYTYFARLNAVTLRNPSLDVYSNNTSILLTRVIAFAYTYHYINWFSKTRIINWHRITAGRAVCIGLVWIASVALYFYNYKLGLKWLLLLSLVHCILEFPLNHRSFMAIGQELKKRLPI